MKNNLKIHAIILALNEEIFIKANLDVIYSFCSKISILTQYDRDWYGKKIDPDLTTKIILDYPDPGGKISLIVRRMPDEAAARNMEMLSFNEKSVYNVLSHGRSKEDILDFHCPPDYFWIIDADEIYDVETLPNIINYLVEKAPKGMRMIGYNYLRSWNRRIPRHVVDFTHFGFLKPGVLFEQRRTVSWNESRFSRLLGMFNLPDFSARMFGFIECPEEIGVFHHGCWLGDDARIKNKFEKSSHQNSHGENPASVDYLYYIEVPNSDLPRNIVDAIWPSSFLDEKD